jgi:23S rRNA pseudouridine1911/1915/1917 synthase
LKAIIWKWQAADGVGRLDRALTDAIGQSQGTWEGEPREVSRSMIQRLIEQGHVLADGAPVRANAKLPPGTPIEIRFPPPEPTELIPEDRELDVLFEDEHLLVLNKPPGLTVHPSSTQKLGTLVHALLHHVKDLSGIGGELRPGIVHRIDKNTSGALVITKTDQAHRKLVEVFSRHDIDRIYWALCYGSPATKEGKITGNIGRNPNERKKMTILEKGGREAITHYKRVEEYGTSGKKPFASLLEVKLETGRTHQVRVHLTSIGHSILGDPAYGTPSLNQPKWKALPEDIKDAITALPGQALHARVLGFIHPITGKALRFEAEPPAQFQALALALGRYR